MPSTPSTGWKRPWVVLVAIVLVAVVAGGVVASGRLTGRPTNELANGTTAQNPDPVPPPSFSALPYSCVASSALGVGPAPRTAYLSGVSVKSHQSFDRINIDFASGAPSLTEMQIQEGASIADLPDGPVFVLKGQYSARIIMRGADGHTRYKGPSDVKSSNPLVVEVRRIRDEGGTVEWAVGLSSKPCYRWAYLDDPVRLTIDFQPA